jgi:hypothetical protein
VLPSRFAFAVSLFAAARLLAQTPPPAAQPASQPAATPAAQPTSSTAAEILPAPQPAVCELPDETIARVHFERALRAWLDGKKDDSRVETKAGLEASPNGRFAPALRGLWSKIDGGTLTPLQTSKLTPSVPAVVPSARAEMVVGATIEGGILGGLVAGAGETDGKAAVGLVMLGTGVGLAGSIALTQGTYVRPAYPAMFETGGIYGAFAVLLGYGIGDGKGNVAGPVALGVGAGSLIGLGAARALDMTGGDAGASFGGLAWGAGLPVLVLAAASSDTSNDKALLWTALVGGTAGAIAGPLLNRSLDWSLSRWRMVNLGGGVGLLFGLGTAVLANASGRGGAALSATGAILGLGISAVATQSWDVDEPREIRSAGLIDVTPEGRVRVGSLGDALKPAVLVSRAGKPDLGASLSILGGRF